MPVSTKFTSKIFDKRAIEQELRNAISRATRAFAAYVPQQQINETHTGKLYKRAGGRGFSRSHRASARGQRPAPDTGKLLKSTTHKMTGELTGEVTTVAKRGGFDYAAQLEKIGRPIQHAPSDRKKAQEILDREAERALKKLG